VDYGAVYFVKQRFGLGVFIRDLNDSERQDLQTNRGVAIRLVVDDTPAYNADILVGDVITAIDTAPISNARAFNAALSGRGGKVVVLSLVRRGKQIEKSVQLNP
jgi:S1-C subfamily serine protease